MDSFLDPTPDRTANAGLRLETHLARVRRYIETGRQADRSILEGDRQTMPDFVALRNRQQPELNLFIADSAANLLQRLKRLPPTFHVRCVLRSTQDAKNGAHHLFFDIQRVAGGPFSFLAIEPAHLKDNSNGRAIILQLLVLLLPDPFFADRRMSCFNAHVQKSGSDCLVFCIDFALKAHLHAAQLRDLHAIHYSGRAIGNDANDPTVEQNNRDTLSIAPASLLPFSFFQHAQSTTALQDAWGSDDARVIRQIRKMQIQRAPRTAIGADDRKYRSSSIERCRRRFLLEALAAEETVAEP